MAGARGGNGSPCGQASGFPGISLGAQAPSLAWRKLTPSLDPRRTPASRDKQPSASKGLGDLGLEWESLA